MSRPYYDHGGITIYHGDCREVLPGLEPVDMLLTDPPYPGLKGGLKDFARDGVAKRRQDSALVAEPWGSDVSALSLACFMRGAMVFCSHHSVAAVPALIDAQPLCLITWYKRNALPPLRNVPHFQSEFVWTFRRAPGLKWDRLKTVYDIPNLNPGCVSTGERFTDQNGKVTHPTQKPLSLISRLLDVGPASVLDPYAGTGTTLLAAYNRGIRAIGIEIEERYCEIAARRLAQEVLPFEVAA